MTDQQFPDFSIWDSIPQDALAETPDKSPTDETIDHKAKAARDKAVQTHDFREKFFKTIRGALVASLLASALLMGVYAISQWGHIDAKVMMSFNAAVVVNTIGLAYIVAKYLFPEGGGD